MIEMKHFSNRYQTETFISPLGSGQLYLGKDLSLQRSVFIYEVPLHGKASVEEYIRKIGKAAYSTDHPHFMHILDIEVGHELIRVVMNYKAGCSFRHFIQKHPISFEDAVSMIIDFGQVLLDAAEERSLDFSLHPDNIWVTDDRKITVIDTWEAPEQNRRLSKELSGLLHQLITRSEKVPSGSEGFALHLNRFLHELSGAKKEAVVTAIANAWNGRLSLASFIQRLHFVLYGMQEEKSSGEPQTTNISLPPRSNEQSFPSEGETETSQNRWRFFRLGKKLWQGMALSLLGLAVFAGVFALLIETTGHKEKPEEPAVSVSNEQTRQPASPDKPNPEAPQKQTANTAPANGENTVQVPTLTGLTQEAAERQALAFGLRYTYYLEVNNQPAGIVFKQEPLPNEKVSKGSRVTFWVSKGPKP